MIKYPQKARRHNDDGEPILNYEKKKIVNENPLAPHGFAGKSSKT